MEPRQVEFDEGWGWGKSLSSWFRISRCMLSAYLGVKWYSTCRHAISFNPHKNPIKKKKQQNPWNVHSKTLWGSCYNPHLIGKILRLRKVMWLIQYLGKTDYDLRKSCFIRPPVFVETKSSSESVHLSARFKKHRLVGVQKHFCSTFSIWAMPFPSLYPNNAEPVMHF